MPAFNFAGGDTQAVPANESAIRPLFGRPSVRANIDALPMRLDACAQHHPEYAEGMSNHLPMALHALHSLGASPERLDAFTRHYAPRLHAAAPDLAPGRSEDGARTPQACGPVPTDELGHIEAHARLLAAMRQCVRERGATAAVAGALPRLMPGVSGAAFHGLLRLAHGLSAGHDGEVAQGLAYWAARHQLLTPDPLHVAPHRALGEWWSAVDARRALPPVSGSLIAIRMRASAEREGFAEMALALCVDRHTLAQIARLAASLYAELGDFTVLHVLTSSWAMQALAPLHTQPELALRHYAAAVAAGWLSRVRVRTPAPLNRLVWAEITRRAIAAEDDHSAKMVYACQRWFALSGDAVFTDAASRAVESVALAAE